MKRNYLLLGFVLLIGTVITSGCGKGYRQIVIVDGQKAEVLTSLEGGAPPVGQEIWATGRIILFRTDSTIPSSSGPVTGAAGHVYRVGTGMKLEDLGEFDAKLTNSVLLARYGE